MAQFYDYKNKKHYRELDFTCKKCDWHGTGEQADEGMESSSGFVLLCPECGEYMDWVDVTVSLDDLLQYGTEKDKAYAVQQQQFYDRVTASRLQSGEQLPEIEADDVVITLCEEETDGNDAYIVLYGNGQEIWREVRTFEYYDRYLALGHILQQKYGDRLVDFEAKHTVYLGGDKLTAFEKVDNFRKTLRRWKPMLGWRVWVAKTTGRKVGLVRWDISSHETKWIDDLVSQDKATHINDGRCPHTYHIKASDILPIVSDDDTLTSYVGPIGYGDVPLLQGMFNGVVRYEDAISDCTPDEILRIELWDMTELKSL